MKNINTAEYWDNLYEQEGNHEHNWRDSPDLFHTITGFAVKNVPSDGDILDLGCGVGVLLKMIKKAKPEAYLTGVDISRVAIDSLMSLNIIGLVEKIPPMKWTNDNSWDMVIACELFEHMDLDDRVYLLNEIKRILKPTGFAVITVPDNCLPPQQIQEHRVMFNVHSFKNTLENVFERVKVIEDETRFSSKSSGIRPSLVGICWKVGKK